MLDTTIYKEKLETHLLNLKNELEAIGHYDADTDNWEAVPDFENISSAADENSNADNVEEWNERRATLEALEKDYRSVKRALQKIELGNYGICEISGEPIEIERLNFRPEARTCIKHKDDESTLSL
jgi:RNA polymerase-binding transcription factor DksA